MEASKLGSARWNPEANDTSDFSAAVNITLIVSYAQCVCKEFLQCVQGYLFGCQFMFSHNEYSHKCSTFARVDKYLKYI